MLEAKGLSKAYETNIIIKDITLKCVKGEFHAIIGPTGAGKTTLLKLLAGLLTPDTGNIYHDGIELEAPDKKLVKGYEEIKLVYQDYALKENMTVEENLNYALLGFEETYKRERIGYLLDLCNLTDSKHQFSSQLSGGQKQRVAIARALATEPEVLLMDEPFSNLDPMTKHQLLQESRAIAKASETSIILVTHDTRDAMEVADKLHLLIEGKFIQQGKPKEVYDAPKNLTIAHLLGYINSVNGKGLWAEKVAIGKGNLTGTVHQIIYKGAYQLISIKSKMGPVLAYDFGFDYQVNQEVKFGYNPNDLITFD